MNTYVVFVTIGTAVSTQSFVLPEIFADKVSALDAWKRACAFYASYYNLEIDYADSDCIFYVEKSGFGLIETVCVGISDTSVHF